MKREESVGQTRWKNAEGARVCDDPFAASKGQSQTLTSHSVLVLLMSGQGDAHATCCSSSTSSSPLRQKELIEAVPYHHGPSLSQNGFQGCCPGSVRRA